MAWWWIMAGRDALSGLFFHADDTHGEGAYPSV